MTLNRQTVTKASRVTLPAYVLVNIGYGLALATEPTSHLLDVPAYRTLHALFDVHVWGYLFIVAGAVQAAALLVHHRPVYVNTLGIGLILGGALTLALFTGAARGTNPWTAPWFPLFYTLGCWASLRSLVANES